MSGSATEIDSAIQDLELSMRLLESLSTQLLSIRSRIQRPSSEAAGQNECENIIPFPKKSFD